ncbi:hypothetical protein DIKCMJMK_03705 [Shewanella oneidensis]|nr:hypothetical protein [Shewanella oneidensis]
MASSINTSSHTTSVSGADNGNYRFALVSLTSLFFMWGFITCLNDILIPHLKAVFSLNYTQAMLIQFCFFGRIFWCRFPRVNSLNDLAIKKGL